MVALDITVANTKASPSPTKNFHPVLNRSSASSPPTSNTASWTSPTPPLDHRRRHRNEPLYPDQIPLQSGHCNSSICQTSCSCPPMSIISEQQQLPSKFYSLIVTVVSWVWIRVVFCYDRFTHWLFPNEPEPLDMETSLFFMKFTLVIFAIGQKWITNFILWLMGIHTSQPGDGGKVQGMRKSWSPSLAFGLSFLKAYLHYSEYLTIEEIQGRSRSIPFMTAPFGIRVHKIKVPVVPYRIKAESMVNDCLTVEEKELVYPRMKFDNCKNSLTRNQNNFNPHGHGAGDKRLKDLNAEWLESTGADIETGTETPNENYGAVIYFHGGGYYTGSKEEHRVLLGPLVKRLGKKIRVLNVGYRLAPQDPFPAALVDALSCYMWVMDQSVSEVFGLDNPEIGRNDRFQPNQIVFMGDSAGSGLVFSLCLLLRDHNTIPQPLAVVAWSPWLDLTQSLPSFEEHGPTDCIPYENFVHKHSAAVDQMFESQEKCCGEDGEPSTELKVRQRAQLYCPDSCLRIKYVSPLFETDFRGITDIFITCGSAERFYNECVLMAAHLEQQQQSCRIDIHEEMPHIFQLFRYHPSASTSLDRSSDYIREMVNRDVERSDEGNIVIPINPSSSSSSSGSASPALSSVSYERSMTNPASTDISGGQEIRHEADIIPPSIQRTNSSLSATSATPEGSTATVASVHPEKQSLLSRHSNRGTGMKTTVNVVDQSGICVVNNIKKRDSFGSIGISGLGKTSSARERRNLTLRDIVTDARLYKWEILLKQGSVPTRHWPDHR